MIATILAKTGLTQAECAAWLRVSVSTMRRWKAIENFVPPERHSGRVNYCYRVAISGDTEEIFNARRSARTMLRERRISSQLRENARVIERLIVFPSIEGI